jgi:LAO/AO transport system kinase
MNRQENKYYIDGIQAGDKYILGKAITLMESELNSDQLLATEVLKELISKTGKSIRLGITGVPGVGKSTFIEAFGDYLISSGKKVAVLAVDPSSEKTGGSILGDKTRMSSLSNNEGAFIRPSPTKNTLGGVSSATRENILLCEAAGYDVIIVETVGVGQSETHVRNMVDFFLLMMLPGAGDELQGIKKGIMEMADGLIINKADGSNLIMAKQAQSDYKNALHMFPPTESGWIPQVNICSSLEKTGLKGAWDMISNHRELLTQKDQLIEMRNNQNITWFREQISHSLLNHFLSNKNNLQLKCQLEKEISQGKVGPKEALNLLMQRAFSFGD